MAPPGQVISLTRTNSSKNTVRARGLAPIINGDEKCARRLALQDAYRQAICQGVGTEIGEMFEMRNFRKVVDVVVKRSIGVVRRYTVIYEGRDKKDPGQYEIVIDAEVGPAGNGGDLMALALFLEVIEHPKVLIMLREEENQADMGPAGGALQITVDGKKEKAELHRSPDPAGAGGAPAEDDVVENALAKYFHEAGYVVLTSKDILPTGEREVQEASLAKQGYSEPARKIGLRCGADIVLCGLIRAVGTTVKSYDTMTVTRVVLTCSAKTVVTGSGQTLNIEDSSYVSAAEMFASAREKSVRTMAKDVGEKLVWRIPEVLANQPKITTVGVANCTVEELKRISTILSAAKGVEMVRTGAWMRQDGGETGKVTFIVSSGFLGDSAEDLLGALKAAQGLKFQVETLSKYNLDLSVIRDGSS